MTIEHVKATKHKPYQALFLQALDFSQDVEEHKLVPNYDVCRITRCLVNGCFI
jgi:hypothetical protein